MSVRRRSVVGIGREGRSGGRESVIHYMTLSLRGNFCEGG